MKKKRIRKKINIEKIKKAEAAKESLRKAKSEAVIERDDFLQKTLPFY